jgi:hypothetical protein
VLKQLKIVLARDNFLLRFGYMIEELFHISAVDAHQVVRLATWFQHCTYQYLVVSKYLAID